MRREQKRQVQEFVELLSQAHEEIKKEIERKDPAAAMGLLAQCQEGAIQMGSLIEATEGCPDDSAAGVLLRTGLWDIRRTGTDDGRAAVRGTREGWGAGSRRRRCCCACKCCHGRRQSL